MEIKFVLIGYALAFLAGIIFHKICSLLSEKPMPKKSGAIVIRKNDEAIDGQVQFTRDLWDISTCNEVSFKVKIISGEPGDWEEKKNG